MYSFFVTTNIVKIRHDFHNQNETDMECIRTYQIIHSYQVSKMNEVIVDENRTWQIRFLILHHDLDL